ncbi:hypothetical protein MNBD_GAMMA01-856 [hydrothermal vent metagenome]|uniref:Uncharacterized protein n=1 Tax=hydrothermal vent metagenome TaxID=652676 RepID=A0A3B0VNK2_9ZZZZ
MNKKFPVYRDANQLIIETKITVKQFSRYHKYTLGSEMRICANSRSHAQRGNA